MNEPHDDSRTFHIPSASGDSLDAGLAAAFGRPPDGPRSRLGAVQPPVVLKPAEGESAHVIKPKSDALPPPAQAGDRYQLQGEIARGGMGAILRGRDMDLGRDLAVKVLLEKYADRPEVVRRFIEEAQIGGQLQHPNVVPIYDIGRFGGRPFFTMKLVKGQTLAALLAEREQPTEDRPRLLGIALKVAQAMAYAHAKGVIHRDLKPANVMVGAFGEVQLMDWGLAKVLAEGGVADEERASRQHQPEGGTQIRTARSGGTAGRHGSDTEAGSLLGTPAYMPPEQANGDAALLDRRADVFGLGALLCEVLTGQPPYGGRSFEEVRRKAANGDLADALARLGGCGADQELIALATRCLSPEAADRPRDAGAVADGLAAYLDGVQERLQAAQRERAVAVAREAERRKRRKVQLALAAAVLGLLLVGGGFAWWRNDMARAGRERNARNGEAVAALLDQSEEALRAGDAAKAAVALDAARRRSAEAGAEEAAGRLDQLAADLALLRDLDKIDQFRWTSVDGHLPDWAPVSARTREALRRFGADPDAVPADGAAARVAASAVRGRIVSALDRLVQRSKAAGARAVLRLVDADPYRDAVRDAILAGDMAKSAELAEQPAALEQPAGFAAYLGELPEIKWERRRQLLAAAVVRWPEDLDLLMTLSEASPAHGKDGADERLRWHQAAVAAAPANPVARINLGGSLMVKGQLDEAIAVYQKAIELDPKLGMARYALGHALQAKGQVDEAIACFRKAIALDPKIAWAHKGLGVALRSKGQLDEAIACFRKAIALDPKNAAAHNNLGVALKDKGQWDEAIACFRKAIELDPKFAGAHNNLGLALRAKGQVDQAIARYRKAIALDPKFALAHTNLGDALLGKGRVDEAIACFRKAIALDPKLANAHNGLGVSLAGKGGWDEAIACFRKAVELDPKNAPAHTNLGQMLAGKGRLDEAIARYRKAIALDPKYAKAHGALGQALLEQGRYAEAKGAAARALALLPEQSSLRATVTQQLQTCERFLKLEERLPRFLRGEDKADSARESLDLAQLCRHKRSYAAAARFSAEAFAADPRLADNLQAGYRYNAACHAALAAAGQDEDAAQPDDKERARLRQEALAWLEADLALRKKQLKGRQSGEAARACAALAHWQNDPDLAGIRDKGALGKLPAQQQKAFAQLWADVATTLRKADKGTK